MGASCSGPEITSSRAVCCQKSLHSGYSLNSALEYVVPEERKPTLEPNSQLDAYIFSPKFIPSSKNTKGTEKINSRTNNDSTITRSGFHHLGQQGASNTQNGVTSSLFASEHPKLLYSAYDLDPAAAQQNSKPLLSEVMEVQDEGSSKAKDSKNSKLLSKADSPPLELPRLDDDVIIAVEVSMHRHSEEGDKDAKDHPDDDEDQTPRLLAKKCPTRKSITYPKNQFPAQEEDEEDFERAATKKPAVLYVTGTETEHNFEIRGSISEIVSDNTENRQEQEREARPPGKTDKRIARNKTQQG